MEPNPNDYITAQTHGERIAKMEARYDALKDDLAEYRVEHKQEIKELRKLIEDLGEPVNALVKKVDRYESKLGAVFLVATSLIALFKMLGESGWAWIKHFFTANGA